MRFDIAFFLCCCRSFLSSSGREEEGESFYDLLGVDKKAAPDELKRAYKRQSLRMHPDKLAQRGTPATEADRERFTRMRHAYEVLSDPRRRETYDAIGERGMRWVEEPLSVDPQELAHNFATSSVCDRSKIFAIFLGAYVAIFLLPVLVCLMADGKLGPQAKWCAVLAPLWLWDALILFYHSRVVTMGPIRRPDHIPEEEWVDPLPMSKRITAMVRFAFLVVFQVLLALRLDGYIGIPWWAVFIPLYLWELIALRRKIALIMVRIVTLDELELAIGKKVSECTPAEREDIHRRFAVVPCKEGPTYDAARRLRDDAKMDVVRILARATFAVLVVLNLELADGDWNWWLVFLPVFALAGCVACSGFAGFARTRAEAEAKDPSLFAPGDEEGGSGGAYAAMDGKDGGGDGGEGGADAAKKPPSPVTDEERDELRARVAASAYRAVGTCLSQCLLVAIACVLVARVQGAPYPSLVVIAPFLAIGAAALCCLACTIFCISEVDEDAGARGFDEEVHRAAAAAAAGNGMAGGKGGGEGGYTPPTAPTTAATQDSKLSDTSEVDAGKKAPPQSTWDPEKGEIWQNTTADEETEEAGDIEMKEKTGDAFDGPRTVSPNPSIPSMMSVTSSQCDLD
ncbi:hypothetical protein ACHAWF_015204 [Thalassiosira exigua]